MSVPCSHARNILCAQSARLCRGAHEGAGLPVLHTHIHTPGFQLYTTNFMYANQCVDVCACTCVTNTYTMSPCNWTATESWFL